jgi:hypothetical protein
MMQLCSTNREVEKYRALCTYTVQTENMSNEQRDVATQKNRGMGVNKSSSITIHYKLWSK